MRYINYSQILRSCEKALKALDCDVAVKENTSEPERAYAMLTTIDAAALHRRIEVTPNVESHVKAKLVKAVYWELFSDDVDSFDVLLAERLCELVALLQVVQFGDKSSRYAITLGHLSAAAALTSASLAANAGGPEHDRHAVEMIRKAKTLSDSANARLNEAFPG